jgi:catechol 2,3-dioxygenase-like lactoylglutathione lyase family enzyme
MHEKSRRLLLEPTSRGVHHLALCTDDMKATIDFYVDVLGMPLVHAMKVPPGLGTGLPPEEAAAKAGAPVARTEIATMPIEPPRRS